MKKHFLFAFCFIFIFLLNVQTKAQAQTLQNVQNQNESVQITYNGGRNYSLVERTDLRRYDNNKYVGLVSREVRSFIINDGDLYDGSFYVDEGTKHQNVSVAQGIHDSIPATFRITSDGNLIMIEDNGYPTFRSFPAFPKSKIKKGDSWTGRAMRSVDPLNKGIFTKMPIDVLYTYIDDEIVRGENVYVFSAKWATRYGISYFDFGGDQNLKSANGSHSATMYVSKETGYAIVVRDAVNENFLYKDGSSVSFRGTISLFTEYPPAVDRSKIIESLQRVALISDDEAKSLENPINESRPLVALASQSGNGKRNSGGDSSNATSASRTSGANSNATSKNRNSDAKNKKDSVVSAAKKSDIKVENTTAGIRLTIQNLQFKADSSELLPGEEKRLEQIATVLKQAGNSQFLVEGHTASTGNEKGEMKLSAERAHAIAEALSKKGIQASRFITKGSGSHKPIADNSTPEGKALNRRVEITILE